MSCDAPNDSIGWPSSNERNASCFSAVSPVCGWNQCVKCVAPRPIAHSLIAWATRGATSWSSFLPCRTASTSLAYVSRGSLSRICRTPKVLMPKYSDVRSGGGAPFSCGMAGTCVRTGRSVISRVIVLRDDAGEELDAGIAVDPQAGVGDGEKCGMYSGSCRICKSRVTRRPFLAVVSRSEGKVVQVVQYCGESGAAFGPHFGGQRR